MKRLVDIVVSAGALLVLSPLILLIAIGVLLDGGGPVLFRQTRPGRDEEPFTLIKFRTMRDERVSGMGGFLRRWSLDELPQLLNVLRGEMSLVGPRPLLPRYLPFYTDRERARHSVRPGMTGWAQIHGRNTASWDERLEMDVWYVENHTLALDLRILLRTVWTVLSGSGVEVDPNALPLPDLEEHRKAQHERSHS